MQGRRRLIVVVAALVVIIGVGAAAVLLLGRNGVEGTGAVQEPTATPAPSPTATPTPVLVESPYNGVLLPEEEYRRRSGRLPLAVMIDNHADARPQSGMTFADLVYEAGVEGSIPRFMAVFWSRDAEYILPVRSARTNFVQWAVELDAVYAHVGTADVPGPANADGQIREYGLPDLDQFYVGQEAYWRIPERYAPYNVATTTELLWAAAEARGYAGPPEVAPWKFKEDDPAPIPEATQIHVSFGPATPVGYDSGWEYDAATNSYLRLQAGAPHHDGTTGERLAARTVIVQLAHYHPAGDGTSHMLYDAIGIGDALIFQDGRVTQATWKKDSVFDRTRFYDVSGQEAAFNRGLIWVVVVPPGYVGYQ